MITEKEAWLMLAKLWDRSLSINPALTPGAMINGIVRTGLCSSIVSLFYAALITLQQMHDMKAKLPCVRRFVWPTTVEGAKERVAFCRKMAEELS